MTYSLEKEKGILTLTGPLQGTPGTNLRDTDNRRCTAQETNRFHSSLLRALIVVACFYYLFFYILLQ